MPGYVNTSGGTLGLLKFEDYGQYDESTYDLATCHPPTAKLWACVHGSCTTANGTAAKPDNKTSFATQQLCAAKCLPPPSPPPPPLSQNPVSSFRRRRRRCPSTAAARCLCC